MSATDELRRMLDERGVEWREHEAPATDCIAFFDGNGWHDCWESVDGEVNVTFSMTPKQAVTATLGSCNCSNDCTNDERTDVPRLPYFWTHDGTLHVELPKLPESISVRLPDQRDREVRSARTWQYTLGSGTCHECAGMDDVFECSACGGRYEGWALKRWARYCPDCGRRIEVDDG